MKSVGIDPCGHTKSLLIRYHTLNKNYNEAINLVKDEPNDTVTPYMFSSAVTACGIDWQEALALLQRANTLNKADEAVFTATAQCCARSNNYIKAFRVIDAMLLRGLPFNKFSFSFTINACLEYQMKGSDALHYLDRYLSIASDRYPVLLTNAVCQKVVRDLLLCKKPVFAGSLHLGPLAHTTCKSDTLGVLLKELQQESEELHIQDIHAKQVKNNNLVINENKMKNENENDKGSVMSVSEHSNSILKNIPQEHSAIDTSGEVEKIEVINSGNDNGEKINGVKELKKEEEEEEEEEEEGGGEEEEGEEEDSEKELEERRNKEMKGLAETGLALVALYCSTNTVRSHSNSGQFKGNIGMKWRDNEEKIESSSGSSGEKYDGVDGENRRGGGEVNENERGKENERENGEEKERMNRRNQGGGEGEVRTGDSRGWSNVRSVSADIPSLPRRHLLRISHFNRYVHTYMRTYIHTHVNVLYFAVLYICVYIVIWCKSIVFIIMQIPIFYVSLIPLSPFFLLFNAPLLCVFTISHFHIISHLHFFSLFSLHFYFSLFP